MSEVIAKPTLEFNGRLFLDVRITKKTQEALLEWKTQLEADGLPMSTSAALEDLCLYGLSKWEDEVEV